MQGYGGSYFYKVGRQVDDHVFTAFEFPGKDKNDRVIVTYSSINTNAFEKYGEEVMGTYGTMIIEEEKEILLYKENDRNKAVLGGRNMSVTMQTGPGGKPAAETSATWAGPSAASSLGGS
ncbi:MAG: gfo/Idh/MocA family oxidoreductase, partial [Isosphaeraceae bacterium]